ncbi:MAG: glutathione S-transferase, partial [Phenylobacterium sp.]|nr:glutathione S-transferase [Phenylobacterium sp.]
EIGRVYTPVMLANARAVMSGAAEVSAEVDGQAWTQQPFPYQAKCLKALRDGRAALAPDARAIVDSALDGTGCEALLAG